jgi:hypothetical protein
MTYTLGPRQVIAEYPGVERAKSIMGAQTKTRNYNNFMNIASNMTLAEFSAAVRDHLAALNLPAHEMHEFGNKISRDADDLGRGHGCAGS